MERGQLPEDQVDQMDQMDPMVQLYINQLAQAHHKVNLLTLQLQQTNLEYIEMSKMLEMSQKRTSELEAENINLRFNNSGSAESGE